MTDFNMLRKGALARKWSDPGLPKGPSKVDLRRMLKQAAANTQASADSATAVRMAKQERRHG